jgi:hypothetical protein
MSVVDWLMDGDPAIRWQVMSDLGGSPGPEVAAERSRVAREGWGARLLSLQAEDGHWGGGIYSPKWVSTTYTLLLLRHLGVAPEAAETRRAVDRVRNRVRWQMNPAPFFGGTGEVCVTGMVVSLGAYFGAVDDSRSAVDWLLARQLPDGGWNCETDSVRSSFHTTISVLEGLAEYEKAGGPGSERLSEARRPGEEYLLERRMFRSLRTGEVIDRRWLLFSFPPRWHYDVLRGLDYLRWVGADPDERVREALDLVVKKRRRDGRWNLQNPHKGRVHFEMEDGAGKPSRWNTLRAMRVLRWAGVAA